MDRAVGRHGDQNGWRTLVVLVAWLVPAVVTVDTAPAAAPPEPTGKPVTVKLDPFLELCKGTFERPTALASLMYCWNDIRNDYGELAPTKVELLNYRPFVAILHDVLHEGEIAKLQQLGDQHIKKTGATNDSWLPVFQENHQTYTLHDRDHPVVETVTQRVEQLTGLSCDTAEDLKVIYNEVGAFKTIDIDVIQTQEDMQRFAYAGNRLATVLFFLNDVTKGGYLTFPRLRLSIPPKKGAAVVWYSLLDTGAPDELAKYSVCPLMEGVKWTAKKIIHTRGNEIRNPCQPKEELAPKEAAN